MAAPVSSTVCSLCGQTLEREGDCLACLLRGGLDESEEEPLPSNSLVFGDFEIELRDDGSLWELGRGAMGVTYRARDKMLRREVALKVIEVPEGAPATRERFLREARAAAAFRHANVASVFQIGAPTDTGRCYYAMELVEGETLATLVRRDGPLPLEAALDIALQVARALVAAAAHGLIHRDLKPANIMLAPNEAQPAALEAKVIDFGLAKATAEAVDEMDLTHGEFVGTPTFASPEQFAGKAADARSDIYSLGVTLWYALTGEVPYEGKTIEEIRHCQSDLPFPVGKLVARKIPTPVIHLLRRVLAVDPTQRPASARELMEALESCRSRLGLVPAHRWKARKTGRKLAALVVVAIAGAVLFAFWLRGHKAADLAPAPAKAIAVLPFENRGGDPANAYFADGIQDEILTRLSTMGDLKVISRTSTEKYRSRPIDLKTVAQDLGVSAILEGSVQKIGGKARVTVQLIEARSDRHLWAGTYDRPLDDIFTVQGEIAGQVASALHASLTPQESAALKSAPTRNQKAYDLFLRAEHFLRIGLQNEATADTQKAIELYRQAVAEDTRFALAYARLSKAESTLRFSGGEPSANAEKALALQPDLVQAHLALAICDFLSRLDYPSALEHLARAQALAPQSAEVLVALGAVYRRQLRFDEAIAAYERAAQYDPGNSKLLHDLAVTCLWAGRDDKVQPNLERALTLDPTNVVAANLLGYFLLDHFGDVEGARSVFRGGGPSLQLELAYTYWATRDYEKAVQLIEELPADSGAFEPLNGGSKDTQIGLALHWAGQNERAWSLLESERDRLIALLADSTDSTRAFTFNSIILAKIELALGHRDAAVQVAERGGQSEAVIRDTIFRDYYRSDLAEIYARAGRNDEAIALISGLLKARGRGTTVTPIMLRLAPTWDQLRDDPRFQALLKEYPTEGAVEVIPDKSIAVLPFENMSQDKGNAYLADGIQEEIRTRLAKIADLKVISRTSTQNYRGKPGNLSEIAKQLGVANILEGSVQKSGEAVHITVQLISAHDDSHLWAQSYDRELKDIFGVEREVAETVAAQLKAKLLPQEATELTRVPTTNPQAYDLYLRARYIDWQFWNGQVDRNKPAVDFYRQAIALDSGFTLAYAFLARAEIRMYRGGEDSSPERIADAQANAEKSVALQPGVIEGHLARAEIYAYSKHDNARALAECEPLLKRSPNDPDIISQVAKLKTRAGDWPAALAGRLRAVELDPRNSQYIRWLGDTYSQLKRYAEADRTFEKALALTPDDSIARLARTWNLMFQGKLADAREAVKAWPDSKSKETALSLKFATLQYIETLSRNYDAAITSGLRIPAMGTRFPSRSLDVGDIKKNTDIGFDALYKGDAACAHEAFATARAGLESERAGHLDDAEFYRYEALIAAGMDNHEAALKAAGKAVALVPIENDASRGPDYLLLLAQVYAHFGEADQAVPLIGKLLDIPSWLSPALLRLDPIWDPIRGDPRFQALLKEYPPDGDEKSPKP